MKCNEWAQVRHKRPRPIYAAKRLLYLPKDPSKTHLPAEQRGPTDKLWVKAGTQTIDNTWMRLRASVPKGTHANEAQVEDTVREFQWRHWHGEDDKWVAAGELFESLRV